MDLMQDIIARAKADKQRIVLPEGTELLKLPTDYWPTV